MKHQFLPPTQKQAEFLFQYFKGMAPAALPLPPRDLEVLSCLAQLVQFCIDQAEERLSPETLHSLDSWQAQLENLLAEVE